MQDTTSDDRIELTGVYSALEHIGDRYEFDFETDDGKQYHVTLRPEHENPNRD